jgi:YHS domain-containing protein
MDWLSQNWIWIALAAGAFFFMTRMGGHGMGGSMRHSYGGGRDTAPPDGGTDLRAVFDPVSRRSVTGGEGISSVYRNQAYYFETRENRDAFEATPESIWPAWRRLARQSMIIAATTVPGATGMDAKTKACSI